MQRVSVVVLAVIVGSFAVLSLAGGRAYVGTLSGTLPASTGQLFLGLAYAGSYFAAVLIAPVLALYALVSRPRRGPS
jgi:hypothetical protein